ncbi:hypothetical protein [uncultured Sphingomonas sp.]|uniref:hypothetical protein n=1 Tax=uncultured Sphingomonas sp. TaxID=158754 RepID=UPI0025D70200|nr:hypothetical protein [uncultured Sphingomonas sp.]
MGDPDGFDDRVFSTLDQVRNHGGDQWWLYASTCRSCGQDWMIAQDERIHDNFLLKRIEPSIMQGIVQASCWPEDFTRFENVLRIERESGKIAQFLNPFDPALIATVADLRRERPDISIDDIAFVLGLSADSSASLARS